MDSQDIINVLIGIVGTGLGYYLNSLNKAVTSLSDKVQHIEVLVAGQYVSKQEFRDEFKNLYEVINNKLDRIDSKLDNKVDK